MYFIYLPLHVK